MLINDELYYAGDSFTIPDGVAVPTLAVPAGAPWLEFFPLEPGESINL